MASRRSCPVGALALALALVQALDDPEQGRTGNVLQAQTMFSARVVGELSVDADDVLVLEFRQRLAFAETALFRHFEGDTAIERYLVSEENRRKAAFA